MNALKRFWNDEEGASMIEYAILLGIIAVASIATIGAIGTWVHGRFEALDTELQNQ